MGTLCRQTAIVAGASSGIGRAIALALAAEGCRVLATGRREDALRRLAEEAAAAGGELAVKRADVCRKADVEALVDTAIQVLGRVDVLVNAAGTNTRLRALSALTDEEWHRLIDTNLNGAYHLTRAVLPAMRRQGEGLVIHIASVSARWPDASGIAYQASKHGIVGLAHATMLEERLNGIRVSVIFPGMCDTPLLELRPSPLSQEILDKAMKPEDIASACVFLAGLPARTYVPELVMMPALLQCVGQTAG